MADNEALGVLLSKIVVDIADLKKGLQAGRSEMQKFQADSAKNFASFKEQASSAFSSAKGHISSVGAQLAALVGISVSVGAALSFVKKSIEGISDTSLKATAGAAMMVSRETIDGVGEQQAAYSKYRDYILQMYKEINAEVENHFASGKEMQGTFNALVQMGIYASKDEARAIGVITDAVKLLHGGFVDQVTVMHEIRGVLEGHAGIHYKLAQQLSTIIGPEWKKIVEEQTKAGTLLKFLEEKYKGLSVASGDIQKTLTAQQTTLDTLISQVGKAGLSGMYEDIVGWVKQINEYLREHKDELASKIASIWDGMRGSVYGVATGIGAITRAIADFAGQLDNISKNPAFMALFGAAAGSRLGPWGAGVGGLAGLAYGIKGGIEHDAAAYQEQLKREQSGLIGYGTEGEGHVTPPVDIKAPPWKPALSAPKGGGGKGGGGKESIDSLLAPTLAMYKAEREVKLQQAQDSLEKLKSTNNLERAELEKKLAEGIIDGAAYYQRLQELQQQETTAALAMIEKKKVAQAKAYQESLTEIEADPKMSDEAKSIARRKMAAENEKSLSKLALEGAQAKLDGEVKVTNELKRQVQVQEQFNRKVEDLELSAAWGPIEEQDAKLRQMTLEWQRAKKDAIEASASTDQLSRMKTAYDSKQWAASPEAEQAKGLAGSITSSFSSLVDSLASGTADLKTSLNSMFKGVFNEALKPGLKSLEQLLMNGFKELFGAVGGAVGSAIMGVIGLVGMLLTSSSSKSFSSSGVTSNVTSSEAVRGIIAGETSIPIAQIGTNMNEALVPTNGILNRWLPEIAANTKGGGGNSLQVNVNVPDFKAAFEEFMKSYFSDYLLMGAK